MSRVRASAGVMVAATVALTLWCATAAARGQEMAVYVGTYTEPGKSQGIYRLAFDPATGRARLVGLAAESVNPSFLAWHPDGRTIYAVNEVSKLGDERGGGASAFRVGPDGGLTALNQQNTKGEAPCHLAVDPTGRFLVVANYSGGNLAVLPVEPDGKLGPASDVVAHTGSSVNPRRQEGPHAHGVHFNPAGGLIAGPDLGIDKVMLYRLDTEAGKLQASNPPSAPVAPGSGPRHLAWHPQGKHAYVINEMASTVTVFDVSDSGALESKQTVTTLPQGYTGESSTAEVVAHPSGKFLYGSNRGHDSLAIFRIDEQSGRLTPAGHQPTGGKTPRSFAIDPTGRFLIAANQGSDSLVVFRIDPETGALTETGSSVAVPAPVCVLFPAGK